MALHGEVKINGSILAYWSARRLVPLGDDLDQVSPYECRVMWTPIPRPGFVQTGNPYPSVTFELEHQYSKGALALAAKVLAYVTAEVAQ